MVPRNPDGSKWAEATSNYCLQVIRENYRGILHQRDVDNGLPPSGMVMNYSAPGKGGNKRAKIVIDHALAQKMHSGAELNELVQKDWYKLCSSPRSEAEIKLSETIRMKGQEPDPDNPARMVAKYTEKSRGGTTYSDLFPGKKLSDSKKASK